MRRFHRLSIVSLVAVLGMILVGCASTTPPGEINAKYQSVFDARWNQYQIKEGDTVTFTFYGEDNDDLGQSAGLLLPDGRVDLFFLNNLLLQGKTIPEFEKLIAEAMKDEVGEDNPDIRVQVEPREQEIIMFGQFTRPGPVPFREKMILREAIARAGGVRITSRPWGATLRRTYLDPSKPDVYNIDLDDESMGLFLLPGDTIELEPNIWARVIEISREYIFGIIPQQLYYGAIYSAGV